MQIVEVDAAAPHVLVVEDDPRTLEAMCRLLRQCGYVAGRASGCAEALSAHAARRCDVLLCDLVLPDGDGTDLLRGMRAAPGGRHVCGIAITGMVGPEHEVAAREAGFVAFIEKPANFDQILDAIENDCGIRPDGGPGKDRRMAAARVP